VIASARPEAPQCRGPRALHLCSVAWLAFVPACGWTKDAAAPLPIVALPSDALRPDATEEWHRVLLGTTPAGYLHVSERALPEGGHVVNARQRLVLRRGTAVVDTEITSTVEEDVDGTVHSFAVVEKLSREAKETRGKREGSRLKVVETVGGQSPRESSVELPPGALGPHAFEELVQKKLKAPGDSVEALVFVPEFYQKCGKEKAVFERVEDVDILGTKMKLRRIALHLEVLPGIPLLEWHDDEFVLQKSVLPVFGLDLATYRSTPEAVAREDFSSPPEVFLSTSVPVRGKVRADARRITYRMSGKSGRLSEIAAKREFPAAGHTASHADASSTRILKVEVVEPDGAVPFPYVAPAGLEEFLSPSSFIQSDDPAIRGAASKAVAGARDAWGAAVQLQRWVHENVRGKNLNTAFASAAEVLTTREGDCTEHAVLLAALLRAVGLPARVVAGLVAYDGAFVGHMWTEVYAGKWLPLDATRSASRVGPDHIGLSVSSLGSASVADLFLDIVGVIGVVRLEVVSVEE
jgi:hypothetical protein